nr:Chain A, Competence-stimulating peptide type 1 [Streptococcus pneumoniae]
EMALSKFFRDFILQRKK